MIWIKRLLLVLPFVIAALLNILTAVSDRFQLRREHIAAYGFLFSSPWAWLLDWVPNPHNGTLQGLTTNLIVLWVPAVLYSACLWLLFRGIRSVRARRSISRQVPD